MNQITDEEVRRIIFVKVDNTLPAPNHPSIAAAAAAIMERVAETIERVRAADAGQRRVDSLSHRPRHSATRVP